MVIAFQNIKKVLLANIVAAHYKPAK